MFAKRYSLEADLPLWIRRDSYAQLPVFIAILSPINLDNDLFRIRNFLVCRVIQKKQKITVGQWSKQQKFKKRCYSTR
jgi:hypothetical protein